MKKRMFALLMMIMFAINVFSQDYSNCPIITWADLIDQDYIIVFEDETAETVIVKIGGDYYVVKE